MIHKKRSARILSLVMTVAMVLGMLPATAFATEGETTPIIKEMLACHTAHDADCGYIQAVEGIPATGGTPCDKACEGEHVADCAYKAAVAEVVAVAGANCTHSCDVCQPQESNAETFVTESDLTITTSLTINNESNNMTCNTKYNHTHSPCWSWVKDTATLTLNNINVAVSDENAIVLETTKPVTVVLNGENTFSTSATAIYSEPNLIFNGSGSLNSTCNYYSIRVYAGTLTIEGGEISSKGEVYASKGITIADGATVTGATQEFINGETKSLTRKGDAPFVISSKKVVTFDARNGKTIDPVVIGESMTLPEPAPWNGYTFAGWYGGIDGTDAEAEPLAITEDDYVLTGKLTPENAKKLTTSTNVYAKWTKNDKTVRTESLDLVMNDDDQSNINQGWSYADGALTLDGVTIDCSGSTVDIESAAAINMTIGDTIHLTENSTNTVTAAEATDDSSYGIYFFGMSRGINDGGSNITGTGTLNVSAGTSLGLNSIGINADGTLSIEKGTVIANGGEAAEGNESTGIFAYNLTIQNGNVTANGGSTGISAPDSLLVKQGIVSAKGSNAAVSTESGITADGATVTGATNPFVSGETTTLIQSGDDPVVISFAPSITLNNGDGTTSIIPIKGGEIEMPANPTWNNYTFGGWYTDKAFTTAFVNSGLTTSTDIYAKWTNGDTGKTVRTTPLNLEEADSENKLSTEGWKWDKETSTLTLSGFTLNTTELNEYKLIEGISLPFENDSTIILMDGTENTVDVSRAKNAISAAGIYSDTLTIKTSGTGTPGKLTAIAAKAEEYGSVAILGESGITIESGIIVATAGESVNGTSAGIWAYEDLHIKNGTVTATGGGSDMDGSFGLYSDVIQIDNGTVTATGDAATLSAGIIGGGGVALNGGTINAQGTLAAVVSLAEGGVTADATVNDKAAKIANKEIDGITISTFLDESDEIIKDAKIKFKADYTGTNPLAPSGSKATKTHTNVTLEEQLITGETVEYGCSDAENGTIIWQNNKEFLNLTPNTKYFFVARVQETTNHKAGVTSAATAITTKTAPQTVSGKVLDSNGDAVVGAKVELKQQPNTPVKTTTTDNTGAYSIAEVPAGVYNLVITKTVDSKETIITDSVAVEGAPVTNGNVSFLDGDKSTIVESTNNAPPVAGSGLNDLLKGTNLDTTLGTQAEKDAVANGGSVELTLVADKSDATEDMSKIQAVAGTQAIGLFFDLSVLKTVKDSSDAVIADGIKIETLANLVKVTLPISTELQGQEDLTIYRVHNGTAEKLPKDTPVAPGVEYFTISADGTYATLYLKNFSTYALGYNAFSVTINDGGANASGAGNYAAGATVAINAGTKSGYTFSGWTSTVTFANASNANTTFAMPSENVTVTANWTMNDGGSGGGSGSGGSGGGSSSTPKYSNTVNQNENGTFTVTPSSPTKGQTVTVTTKPDAGYVVDQVIVKDANGNEITVTDKGTNSYTFVQPAGKVTVEVTYKKADASSEPSTEPDGESTFADVVTGDWFYDAVMAATEKGWFAGTTETTFSPNVATTRGMIATILHRIEGAPSADAASFDDVVAGEWYANGVAWAESNGIVGGYGNGNYGPNDNISREQLAAILYRYAKHKGYDVSQNGNLDGFSDKTKVTPYATEAMGWAVGSGLLSGRGNGILAPDATATRAEVASILVRFEKLFTK